jgi:hypothetical protein
MSEDKKLKIALISLHGLIRGRTWNWAGTRTRAGRRAMCWTWRGRCRRIRAWSGWI